MIKFCIALALLATISLSAVCDTNVILNSNTPCHCHATSTDAQYYLYSTDDGASGSNRIQNNYCRKDDDGLSQSTYPGLECTAAYETTLAINARYTGNDCRIDGTYNVGNKICTKNGVYKESAASCPLMPAVCTTEQKTLHFATATGGDGCQCVDDEFCAADKFCYDGACNDAAKLCSVWPAAECDGLDRTASTCLDAGCDQLTCCEPFIVKSAA